MKGSPVAQSMDRFETEKVQEAVAPGLEGFVPDFFEDRKKDLRELRSLITDKNYDSARKIAHNWKGFCEPYGFAGLGLLAAELEVALKAEDHAQVQRLLFNIDQYFQRKVLPVVKN